MLQPASPVTVLLVDGDYVEIPIHTGGPMATKQQARPTKKAAAPRTPAAPKAADKIRCPACNGLTLNMEASATSTIRGTHTAPELNAKSASFTAVCTKGDFTMTRPDFVGLMKDLANTTK